MAPPKPGAMAFRDLSPTTAYKRRLIISIEGAEKSGKNHFAFTAPGKTAFHSFDHGDEGMIEKFVKGGLRIQKAEYRVDVPPGTDTQKTSEACNPVWLGFKVNFALGLHQCRTTVVDTGTDMYEMLRMAYFGKLQQVLAHHYAPVNAELKSLIHQAYSSDGNLIVLHRIKDEYKTEVRGGKEVSNKTGKKVMAGYSQMKFETQVHLRMYKEDGEFCAEVVTCRQNPDIEGYVLTGDQLSFTGLGMMVYPDSEEGEWQ